MHFFFCQWLFMWVLGNQAQVFTFIQQVLCPLSHFPSPISLFLTRTKGLSCCPKHLFILLVQAIIDVFFCPMQWSVISCPLSLTHSPKMQPATVDCFGLVWLSVFEKGSCCVTHFHLELVYCQG